MYALKARDKLHKKAKEEKRSPRNPKRKSASGGNSRDCPVTVNREAKYVGSFSIDMGGGWKSDFVKTVKQQLSRVNTKEPSLSPSFVSLRINMEGIKVLSPDGRDVIMAHALKRMLYCTADPKKHLFAIVARNAQEGTEGVYTHVFVTDKKDQANELNQLVSKAFKVHFASKSIERQRKVLVQHAPKNRRSPSPNPRSISPSPPSNQAPPPSNPAYNSAPPSSNPAVVPVTRDTQPWAGPQVSSVGSWEELSSPHTAALPTAPPPSGCNEAGEARNGGVISRAHGELVQEVGVLELEMATLQQRLMEIQDQMRELACIEDAVVQLTSQLSHVQQQLDDKNRRHHTVLSQLQSQALHNHSNPQPSTQAALPSFPDQSFLQPEAPPSYPGGVGGYNSNPLPDFSNMSLEDAEWFHEGIPRDIAMEVLAQQHEGAFMVRQSGSSPGSYALTMKAPHNNILNYLIENVPGGVRLQGSAMIHPSIMELVHSYTINGENLPCTLNVSTANPAFLPSDGTDGAQEASDSDEDEEYMTPAHYRLIS